MNKHYLQSKMKSTGAAYAMWFFLWAHFAYLGKWGLQILFWFTIGGLGIWWFIEMFLISGRVNKHNMYLSQQISDIEFLEKEEAHSRNLEMIAALQSGKQKSE